MFPKGLVSCYRALSCYLLFVYSNLITPCVDTGVSFSHQDLYAGCSPGGEFSHQDLYPRCSPEGKFSHQDLYAGCNPNNGVVGFLRTIPCLLARRFSLFIYHMTGLFATGFFSSISIPCLLYIHDRHNGQLQVSFEKGEYGAMAVP